MRTNILNCNPRSSTGKLLKHLLSLVAEDYQVSMQALTERLATGCPELADTVTQSLRNQGWLISWYQMPPDYGYPDMISMGFWIEPACDKLIAWRLAHV